MQKRSVTIRNRAGIHCRPSSVILQAVGNEFSDHKFLLTNPAGDSCELNSIMGLLALGLARGDTAELQVEGPREDEAIVKVAGLLEREYDFPPQK